MGIIKIKKPKVIVFDVSGTATKSSFIDKLLFPYIKKNLGSYLNEFWEKEVIRHIDKIREEVDKERITNPNMPSIAAKSDTKEIVIESVVKNFFYCLDNKKESNAHQMLKFAIWFNAYKNDRIKTPIYSDVVAQLKKWRENQIKLFVFSNGWVEAQKVFLAHTNHGNIDQYINGHFDTDLGELTNPDSFKKILDQVKENPHDVVFLTKSPEEAKAASSVGIRSVLCLTHRRNIERLDKTVLKDFQRIRSFYELEFE